MVHRHHASIIDGAPHRRVVTTEQRSEAPIPRLVRPVVAVQRGDMHVPGGHREQRRQRTQRDAWNRGAIVIVVVSRCIRSIASGICNLSASSTSATQPCSTLVACRRRRQTRGGRPRTRSSYIKGGECPGMQKSRGETSGGRCPGGNVRLPNQPYWW